MEIYKNWFSWQQIIKSYYHIKKTNSIREKLFLTTLESVRFKKRNENEKRNYIALALKSNFTADKKK